MQSYILLFLVIFHELPANVARNVYIFVLVIIYNLHKFAYKIDKIKI